METTTIYFNKKSPNDMSQIRSDVDNSWEKIKKAEPRKSKYLKYKFTDDELLASSAKKMVKHLNTTYGKDFNAKYGAYPYQSDATNPPIRVISKVLKSLLKGVKLDTNQDGIIDKAEFLKAMPKIKQNAEKVSADQISDAKWYVSKFDKYLKSDNIKSIEIMAD